MNRKQIVLAFTIACVGSMLSAAVAANLEQAISLPGKPIWMRQLIKVNQPANSDVQLIVSGRGVGSVYVNGQRLGRSIDLNKSPVAWDISKLVRTGRNSVALTVDTAQPAELSVQLKGVAEKLAANAWKSVTVAPPVGWQQTDFNDRDWKPTATVESKTGPGNIENIRVLTWSKDSGPSRVSDGKFQFRSGDHVVMLGGTFIERAQSYGHLESALNCSTKDPVTFRNLAWSADTVFADSRGIFDSPVKGYERMIEHVRAEEPSVILICYGQNAALDGPWNADRFSKQLVRLCNDLRTTDAEIVLFSPHPFLDVDRPYPSPARWNKTLQQVTQTVRNVALAEGLHFVDLFDNFVNQLSTVRLASMRAHLLGDLTENPELMQMEQDAWSDNGMHWTNEGYARVARVVASRLLSETSAPIELVVNFRSSEVSTGSGTIRNIQWGKKEIQFEFQASSVSAAPVSVTVNAPDFSGDFQLSVKLEGETHSQKLATLPDGESDLQATFLNPEYERLRQLTVRKNELYFYRWRPQNITYLFGFRKHEQGNNASEIAQFDPLISSLEKRITLTKQPQWQTITIAPRKGQ